jgi:predicted O-methyltransferase YrrM
VRLHEGDSAAGLDSVQDGFFDLIYIDAGHSYAAVKKDSAAAVRKVKEDGVIVFNDYTIWSPMEAKPYGVVRAVNELVCEGWDVVGFAVAAHGYHDIALQRPA